MFLNTWCGSLRIQLTFCIFLSMFSLQMGKECNDTYSSVIDWVSDPSFNDIIVQLSDNVIQKPWSATVKAGNLTTCAEKCIQIPECSSFFVDIQGKECILHEIIFLSSDAGNQSVVADGARYFKRSEDSCPASEGFFRWRSDGLCFKAFLNVSLPTSSDLGRLYCKEKVKGDLLRLNFKTNFIWFLKVLMQLPPKYYNYARFRDQTLRPHMCRIPVQNDIQVGSELDCLYLKDDSLLRQEENYNIFCEVF